MVGRAIITTTSAKATTTDLVALPVVKEELGINDSGSDQRLKRYIAEASMAAQQYCNRIFAVQSYRDEFWPTRDAYPTVIPGGEDPLQLTRWPLVAVSSVVENGAILTPLKDYRIDAEKGQLLRLDGSGYPKKWAALPILVDYVAGYDPLPADVSGKIVRLVTARYFAAGRDPAMMSESIPGVRDYRIWVPTGSDAGNLPPDVEDVLNNYRQPMIA